MPKIGVIGIKGGWSSEILADKAAEVTGEERLLIEMDKVRLDLNTGACWYENTDISRLDALIVKKIGSTYHPDMLDRLEMLRFLEERGMPIFSPAISILRILDRLSCTVTLRANDIPMPPTMITENIDEACKAVEEFGQAVFKPLYTSKARGMFVLDHGPDAREAIAEYAKDFPVMYIQKTINMPDHDLGIVFLGGEYVTTYARAKTNSAWNTTTASGGKYIAVDPEPEIIELARRAQAPFNMTFTCVDVAITDDGPVVFEVSAFGGFRGLLDARGIDAAELYVNHVLERIR